MGKLDDLLREGTEKNLSVLVRAGLGDGLTYEQIGPVLRRAGVLKSPPPYKPYDPEYDGSPLPHDEQDAIRAMEPEQRMEYSFYRNRMTQAQREAYWRDRMLPALFGPDIEKTGQDVWDENGGSPHEDPAERASEGVWQHITDENGDVVPGVLRHKPSDREMNMEVVKARQTLDLAGL